MLSTPPLCLMNSRKVQSCRPLIALLVGFGLHLLALTTNAAGTTLVSSNSVWSYLDDGSDQGTAWRSAMFDDSGWSSGAAPLGYGLTGIATTQATARVTYYHRRTFDVDAPDVYSNLIVRLRRDDGGIVYINDTEVFRSNMPTGAVDFSTLATISATGPSQFNSFIKQVSPGVLVPGVNRVAVEIHQSGTSSVDAAFDFELSADGDTSPPTIVDTNQPSSGVVLQGRSFSLTVTASGAPPLSYQWYFKQGSSVFQLLPGANSDTYSITNMQLTNEGYYYVSITNSFGVTDSPIATVGFAPDADPPIIVSLNSVTNNRIGLCFSEAVTLPSAINPLNYTVDAGFSIVTNVVLRADGKSVELFLGSPIDKFFSVAVTNIEDLAGNFTADARTGYISQYTSTTVGTLSNPDPAGSVYSCFWDSFEVTVGGDIGGTSDHFHFIEQGVAGDFDARVRVTRLDCAGQFSKAGLMARETLAADSRTVQTHFTPAAGANQVEVAVRATSGGGTTDTDFQIGPRAPADPLRWLRMTRTNDTFTTYHGEDGVHWTISGMTTQAFNATLHVGMAVAAQAPGAAPLASRASSQSSGATTTAGFTDFFVQGAQPGDDIVPTMVASIEATTLRLQWEVTPRDFSSCCRRKRRTAMPSISSSWPRKNIAATSSSRSAARFIRSPAMIRLPRRRNATSRWRPR